MSRPQTAEETRADFLAFFGERGHEIVPSDSLVPQNDPTLLFTNAGMNQFKDVFLGEGSRPYLRAVDTQKCLRVSGKHNDLEEVGYDTYHHTFFEMLGNWSFGDYFKKEAIGWAWELLVDRWGLDGSRLYATVHEGDEKLGLDADDEAAGYWRSETGIDPDHILYCSSKDNFWMMGETGPCGPCSEIHVDMRPDDERARVPGRDLVNAGDSRVIEIWNLVFIQYNALPDGSLQALKAMHVDTGMGFERMVAVLQGKTSNYDTDLFRPVLDAVAAMSPRTDVRSYSDVDESADADRIRVAIRVVADHVRTVTFAVADGVMPGNAGRGYVIRRILRRAVRFGYQTLQLHEPFLYRVADTVIGLMRRQFPEIERNRSYIERVIRAEEESFLETLGTGLQFFEQVVPYLKALDEGQGQDAVLGRLRKDRGIQDLLGKAYADISDRSEILRRFLQAASRGELPGEITFLLHDTYGFPWDLTQLMAREEGYAVDLDRYQVLMQEQKDRARAASSFRVDQSSGDAWEVVSGGDDSRFRGYEESSVDDAVIRAVREVRSEEGPRIEIILDTTPFYAESGGEVGDTGFLLVGDEEIRVLDTQRRQGRIVHTVDRLPADPTAPVRAVVDTDRLVRIRKHHTVTHLMHAALREVLGPHVAQKGSLVAPDHLRFDFSHFERVTPDELRAVERRVNEVIQRNVERREERDVPLQDALERGAMALFGEKYGDRVRVITFDPDYSVELCGGQHVEATGEIGVFRFTSEGSVAAGIRRVEAVAGGDAVRFLHGELDELGRVRGQFRSLQRPSDEEVADLLAQNRRLEKALEEARHAALTSSLEGIMHRAEAIGDLRLAVGRVGPVDMGALRALGESLRERAGSATVGILGSTDPDGSKAYLVVTVSDDLVDRGVQAGRLVGLLAERVDGGGGGRPQLATAGGRSPEKLDEALRYASSLVRDLLA